MKSIYETERLILRPLKESDVDGMFALDSNPNVLRYLDSPVISNKADSLKQIRRALKNYQDFNIGRWGVELKSDGSFIGWSGLQFVQEESNGIKDYYDIGYRFNENYWGKGYGFESAKKWLEIAFNDMQLERVDGHAMSANTGSIKILKKIGLKPLNHFKHKEYDCEWFYLNKGEYFEKNSKHEL